MIKKSDEKNINSTLYIVSTPIGNLEDITKRALTILMQVNFVACEDIYHTKNLLKHFSIKRSLLLLNNQNEQSQSKKLLTILKNKKNIALVSKAGTPLISDPGYTLVKMCHQEGIKVIVIPGVCAAITALVGSGLPANRFLYEGFLPSKKNVRCKKLEELKYCPYTLIFYESKHRIFDSMEDIKNILGSERYVVLARELTKYYESIKGEKIFKLIQWMKEDSKRIKGEIVLIIEGYSNKHIILDIIPSTVLKTISILRSELSLKKAVKITSEIYGIKKNFLYKNCLKIF